MGKTEPAWCCPTQKVLTLRFSDHHLILVFSLWHSCDPAILDTSQQISVVQDSSLLTLQSCIYTPLRADRTTSRANASRSFTNILQQLHQSP